jgi:hypothetical protein
VAVESGGWRPQVAAESCGRRRVRQQEEIFLCPITVWRERGEKEKECTRLQKKKIIHQVSHEHTKSRHVSPGAYVHPLTDEHMSRIFNGHQTFIGFGHRRL